MTNTRDKDDIIDMSETLAEKPRPARKILTALDPDIFGDVQVQLAASLGHGEMTVSDLLNLESGAVVPLDTPLNGLVDLKFNDRVVARGEIVSVGDQFGIRITEVAARKA